MSCRTYGHYVKTGVQWLGQVPSHWRQAPFWTLFRRTKRVGFGDEELLSVYRDYGVIPRSSRDDNFNKPSDDLNDYQLVEFGDLVFNKMKAWQGSVGIAAHRGIVSPAYFVYLPLHSENPSYLSYLLRSAEYAAGYFSLSKGIRVNQWDVEPQSLRVMPIVLPSAAEQASIVAFVDREVGKIDALVAEQERLIALLKEKRQALISHAVTKGLDPNVPMKDSGVEWLGQVPAHWEVKRLKFVAQVQTGIAKGKDVNGRAVVEVPYLRVANVQDGYLDLDEISTIEIEADLLQRYRLRVGDVLMNEGGDYDKLGRGHVWHGQIDPCIHQNHVFAVRPFGVSPDWLNRFTCTSQAQFYFMTRSKQSTNLASISSANIMELPVVVPPLSEQIAVLKSLEASLASTDALMQAAETSIRLLGERRSALISAAVTGKIDVRGLVA